MKNLYLRTSVALACAFGLAACGGGGKNLQLVINPITGVTQDGMTISNNNGTPIPIPAGTGAFAFPDLIGNDTKFDIKIVTPPSNATCTVYNGTGKTGAYAPSGIAIQCIAIPHIVTAMVSGLSDTGTVTVVNGSAFYNITASALVDGKFELTKTVNGVKTGQVGEGDAYGFEVLHQPSSPAQNCTILDGGSIMDKLDVTIHINCV